MSSPHYIETAAIVLANCRSHDPYFPKASDSMTLAWAKIFEESRLSRDDILAGVDHAYLTAEEGFRPLAATIVRHAHTAYFEALKHLPDDRRQIMEEANFALQDMGFTPNEAHRYSRAIALGRKANLALTEGQDKELRQRLAKAREVQALPPREIGSLWTVEPDRNISRDPRRAFQKPDEPQDDAA